MQKPARITGILVTTIVAATVVTAVVLRRGGREAGPLVTDTPPQFPAFEGVYTEWGFGIAPVADAASYTWHVDYEDARHWSLRLDGVSTNIVDLVPEIFPGAKRPQELGQTIRYSDTLYSLIDSNGTVVTTDTIEAAPVVSRWLHASFVDAMMSNPDVVDSESDIVGTRQMEVESTEPCTALGHLTFQEKHPGVLGDCVGGKRIAKSIVRYRIGDRIPTFLEITVDGVATRRVEWERLEVAE